MDFDTICSDLGFDLMCGYTIVEDDIDAFPSPIVRYSRNDMIDFCLVGNAQSVAELLNQRCVGLRNRRMYLQKLG